MIEQPPSLPGQPYRHLFDTLVHDGQDFKVWEDAQTFKQESPQSFQGLDFTDELQQSVGCLIQRDGNFFELLATAFVVRHLPEPSNLFIDNSPVKALLLTAAHVYSSPLDSQDLTQDVFFTLSPSLKDATLATYSKFRVKRLLDFDPSTEEPQIDPLLDYQYMVPQDVELLAVLEGDLGHQMAVNGNDFRPLEHQSLKLLNQCGAGLACVIVGYPGQLGDDYEELWAPIIGRNSQFLACAREIGYVQKTDPKRAFSRGEIIRANNTCVAVNCSTWKGMARSPICILSQNGQRLDYCGVCNGSAALPFEALLSKILFRFQGKAFQFTADDIPRIPVYGINQLLYQRPEDRHQSQIRSKLLWVEAMRKLLWIFHGGDKNLAGLVTHLKNPLRRLLGVAESVGINVEHNLGICGGGRFSEIIECVERSKTINTNEDNLLQFGGLTRLDAIGTSLPLTENQKDDNVRVFLEQGIEGKRKKFLIFSDDAYQLSLKLHSEVRRFVDKVKGHITTIDEKSFDRKFEKIRHKFSKIFEIWRTAL